MAGLDLENRPWYFAVIIGAIIAGGLVWAFERFVFTDIQKDINARSNDLKALQQKVTEGKAAEQRLPQFREEFERLDTELQRLLRILPTLKQTDELIKKLKSLTERGIFRLASFQPQGFIKKDFYSEWPVNIALDANYHELALFFDRLSRFSRIINVESLDLKATNRANSSYSVSASFTMKTFIYGEVKQEGARQ